MSDHIFQKKGESAWYVRLDVPKDVQAALNRKVFVKSLKTSNRSEAMQLRHTPLSEWKAQIRMARSFKSENAEIWRQDIKEISIAKNNSLREFIASLYLEDDTSPIETDNDTPFEGNALDLVKKLVLFPAAFIELGYRNEGLSFIEQIKNILNRLAAIPSAEEMISIAKDFSVINDEIFLFARSIRFSLSDSEIEEAREIQRNPKTYSSPPITKSVIENWKKHLSEQISSQKTIDSHISRIKKINDWLKEANLSISFDSIHDFLEASKKSTKTKRQYLWSGRQFWEWAIKYASSFREKYKNQANPFNNHVLPKIEKKPASSYEPFTYEELNLIYQAVKAKKDNDLHDLIVIAAYSGARLEEIGRIRSEDIKMIDRTPISFQVKQAKTKAGIREVPIHSKIKSIIMERIDLSHNQEGYLFKSGKNKYNNRLDYLGKRFGKIKSKLGFNENKVFHSIRKAAITHMHQNGVSIEVLPYIVGHETGFFTLKVYSAGPTFKQKKKAIEKIHYNFPDGI